MKLIVVITFRSLLEDSADEIEIDIPSTKVQLFFPHQIQHSTLFLLFKCIKSMKIVKSTRDETNKLNRCFVLI